MSKVLITESKIENIADRLRAKTNINENISLEQMEIDIAGTPSQITEEIPEYIRTETRRLANVVKSRQDTCNNFISFIAVSDIHHSGTENSLNVLKHCSMGAYLIKKYVPIDFGVMLGDYIRGSSSDTEDTSKTQYLDVLNYFSSFVDIGTQGNHDSGMGWWDSFLNYSDLYNRISRFARNPVRPSTNSDRGYYYYDVPNKNFRVIVLNTNDIKDMQLKPHSTSGSYFDGHRFSMTQLKWLRDVLLDMPSVYSFIVCSHEPIHWGDSSYTDANNVTWECKQLWRTLLNAYVEGSSYSITLDNETITGDFSRSNVATLVGTFHGHTHNFIQGTYGTGNILRIGTPNACNGRTNEYGSTAYGQAFREKFGELDENGNQVTTYFKTAVGTTNETAFVVNTIDLDNQIIYSDYYGAGHNRVIDYSGLETYTINNNLTHLTNSNSNSTIKENSSYSATLTPDEGYELSTVVVTMGGVQQQVTGNTINIARVTGNIVINATATIIVGTHSITKNLTNTSISNNAETITEGETYTATLEGSTYFKLGTVTVTMGGIDITSQSYSNGNITINDVNGDINITVVSTELDLTKLGAQTSPTYPAEGYTDNARWSAGNGALKTNVSGYVAVNPISFSRAQNETLIITLSNDVDWSYSGSNCVIALFADDTFKYGGYLNTTSKSDSHGCEKIVSGDGSVVVKIYDPTNSDYEGINSVRFSGFGTGSNVKITITRELTENI